MSGVTFLQEESRQVHSDYTNEYTTPSFLSLFFTLIKLCKKFFSNNKDELRFTKCDGNTFSQVAGTRDMTLARLLSYGLC